MANIQYLFKTPALLKAALTHRSNRSKHAVDNERLEFLGDAILSFVISDQLYQRFSEATEGHLSRMRALLVKGPTLAEIAHDLGISPFLQLGLSEKRSGGFQRASILVDALEAMIAAIYLDGGLEAVRLCILRWYNERLTALIPDACHKDPKTKLQEFLQAKQCPLPLYTILEIKGDPHHPLFKVECIVEALGIKIIKLGVASSRRYAEQAAAQLVLRLLEKKEATLSI